MHRDVKNNKSKIGRSRWPLLVLMLSCVWLSSAAKVQAQSTAYLRVLHAIPGDPKVDIHVDGEKSMNDVTYATPTNYIKVPAGTRRLQVFSTGQSFPMLQGLKTMVPNSAYTLIIYGTPRRERLLVHNESNSYTRPGRTRLHFIHLSPNARPLSIGYRYYGARFTPLIRRMGLGQARSALIPSGPATLQIRSVGRVIKTAGAPLKNGQTQSAFIIGRVGAAGEQAFKVLVVDAGGP